MRYSAGLTDKQWQVIEKKLNDKERKQKNICFVSRFFHLK